MEITDPLSAKTAKLSLIAVCVVLLLFTMSSSVSVAYSATIKASPGAATGGAATGGAATGGAASNGPANCYGTCYFYGGPATGGTANGGSATGSKDNTESEVNKNFITHNISSLKLKIQTPVQWEGPTPCETTYSGGALHIKSSRCVVIFTPNIANVQFSITRQFSVDLSNTKHRSLDKLANEIKDSTTDRYVNPNIVDFIGMDKDTLNRVYPTYVFKFTEKNTVDNSIYNKLSVLVGTPDYEPWIYINFSASPDEYNQLMPTIQKILNSVTMIE